jgi:hypothetical protein
MAGESERTPRAKSVTVSSTDITWIKEKLNALDKNINEVNMTLSKQNTTIVGDSAYGQKGLVERIEEIEDYILTDRSFKSRLVGGGLVIGAIWTLILEFKEKLF